MPESFPKFSLLSVFLSFYLLSSSGDSSNNWTNFRPWIHSLSVYRSSKTLNRGLSSRLKLPLRFEPPPSPLLRDESDQDSSLFFLREPRIKPDGVGVMLLEKVRGGKDEKETAYFPFPPPAYFALSPRTPLGLIVIKSVLSRNYSVTRVRFRYSWMDGFLECDRGERKRLNDLNRGKFRIIFRNEDESNSIQIV